MAEKKSIFAKAVEVAKKAVAKPAAKKAVNLLNLNLQLRKQ
jgi:DnaK suppressor protein